MHKVAVYGSLRKGLGNHVLLRDSQLISTETVSLPYRMLSMGGFPGLVPSDNIHDIVVEVYEVTDDTLQDLNSLEGYYGKNNQHNFYNRVKIETNVGEAFIYILNRGHESSMKDRIWVDSGDWKAFKTKPQVV